ncbi:MAG: hypothetical protein AB7M93_26060 [Candidatus Obscuribacterales bacterium]
MTTTTQNTTDIKEQVRTAMDKVKATKEADLARYLPGESGETCMHHLSYRHLKNRDPISLGDLLQQHIIDKKKPEILPSPPRARRQKSGVQGKRTVKVSPGLLRKVADRLAAAGEHDLVGELEPALRTEREIVKELIAAIKRREKPASLWEAYLRRVAQT